MQDLGIGLGRKVFRLDEVLLEERFEVLEGAKPFMAASIGVPAIPVVRPAESPPMVLVNRHDADLGSVVDD